MSDNASYSISKTDPPPNIEHGEEGTYTDRRGGRYTRIDGTCACISARGSEADGDLLRESRGAEEERAENDQERR